MKKYSVIIFLLIFTFTFTNVYSQYVWTKQNSGVTSLLATITFINNDTGLVVGNDGVILKTIDGGSKWTKINTGFTTAISSLSIVDENIAYASGDNGLIIKSTDGGNTWTKQSSGYSDLLYSINFYDKDIGYATGMGGIILKTTDGGTTWNYIGSTGVNSYRVEVINEKSVFISGRNGVIYHTSDGGNSWSRVTTNTSELLIYMKFYNNQFGICVGDNGTILKTTDGGTTWSKKNSGTSLYLNNVQFADENTVYVVGYDGLILKSLDKGETWYTNTSNTTDRLISSSFPSKNVGYAAGINGTIMKLSLDTETIVDYCSLNNEVTLTAPDGYSSYTWLDQKARTIGYTQSVTIQDPSDNSYYKVFVSSTQRFVYRINRYDVSADFIYTNDCSSNVFSFTNLSSTNKGTLSYYWDFGDETNSTEENPKHIYTISDAKQVKLIVSNQATDCVDTAKTILYPFDKEKIKIVGDTMLCAGDSVIVGAEGAYSYLWSTGETTDFIKISTSGNYWVIGYSQDGTCYGSDSITVNQFPNWNLSVRGNLYLCLGSSSTLYASGAKSYLWNTGETSDSIMVFEPGTYSVIGTNENGCIKSDSVVVTQLELPNVNFSLSNNKINESNSTVTVSITQEPNVTYSWDMGDGIQYTGNSITHTYSIDGNQTIYYITLTAVNNLDCQNDIVKAVEVALFIPNVFTPNGDGVNDVFMPNVNLTIYDRNGILMYQGTDGWNGEYKNSKADNDTYFYYIEYPDSTGIFKKLKGFIMLKR